VIFIMIISFLDQGGGPPEGGVMGEAQTL